MDQAAKKEIRLTQQLEPGLARVYGDLDRLQQLFINLVDNAVKYTPAGGEVTLIASSVVAGNGAAQIQISVTDTGPGIPEKDLPRLTERFYRVDKARSRDLGGTGLGLAIVKHIVQAHKGELSIDSTLNKGTTVRVRLLAAPSNTAHKTILFLCTGNSCRSQMAEGFARQIGNGTRIFSAGSAPRQIHPLTARVMKEAGVDISKQRSKGLDAVPLDQVDLLITLGDEAKDSCGSLPSKADCAHWPLVDPTATQGDHEQVLQAFRSARDEIRARVQELFSKPRL